MSGVVRIGKYLNIMEDFVVCLCLESLYMCALVFGFMCLRAHVCVCVCVPDISGKSSAPRKKRNS